MWHHRGVAYVNLRLSIQSPLVGYQLIKSSSSLRSLLSINTASLILPKIPVIEILEVNHRLECKTPKYWIRFIKPTLHRFLLLRNTSKTKWNPKEPLLTTCHLIIKPLQAGIKFPMRRSTIQCFTIKCMVRVRIIKEKILRRFPQKIHNKPSSRVMLTLKQRNYSEKEWSILRLF